MLTQPASSQQKLWSKRAYHVMHWPCIYGLGFLTSTGVWLGTTETEIVVALWAHEKKGIYFFPTYWKKNLKHFHLTLLEPGASWEFWRPYDISLLLICVRSYLSVSVECLLDCIKLLLFCEYKEKTCVRAVGCWCVYVDGNWCLAAVCSQRQRDIWRLWSASLSDECARHGKQTVEYVG